MKLGFITINFHSDKDTLDLVRGLSSAQVPKDSQISIYVVDNSLSTRLKKSLKTYSNVIYITSPGNVGFATANNLGLRQAIADQNDLLILINNDTLVDTDFILKVIDSPITKPDVGAVGGLIYFAPGFEFQDHYKPADLGHVIWYAGGVFDSANIYGSHRGVDQVDVGQYSKRGTTDFITGCLFITKPEVIKKVGFFDDNYFLYLEDLDLNFRIQKMGYKLIFDPSVKLSHKVAQSSGIGSPLNDYFITRNRLLFGFKHSSFRTKFALVREAMRKLFTGTDAQKVAIKDFFMFNLYKGSWIQ